MKQKVANNAMKLLMGRSGSPHTLSVAINGPIKNDAKIYKKGFIMKLNPLAIALIFLSTLPITAHAALIDHGAYITDTITGLDWLKLTETMDRTYDDVSTNLGNGKEFDGWEYASRVQFANLLWDYGIYNAGIPPHLHEVPLDNSYLMSTNAFTPWDFIVLFGSIDPYPSQLDGLRSTGLLAKVEGDDFGFAHLFSYYPNAYEDNKLFYAPGMPTLNCTTCSYQSTTSAWGSYLVRPSEVPITGTAILFGSGLAGLIGAGRRSTKINY